MEVEGDRIASISASPRDEHPSALLQSIPGAVHADCRIDRPYVRKGWLHGDRAGGTIRGAESFVPMSWDEATRLVGEELSRVGSEFGRSAIYGGSYGWSSAGRFHHAKSQLQRMLAATGGYTGAKTNYSYATGMTLLPHILGDSAMVEGPLVEWRAIAENAKLMVCFGGMLLRNGQVSNGGPGVHEMETWVRHAARSGVKFVYVSPAKADFFSGVEAEWVPIRPNTDTAFMLAVAHVLISESLVDEAYCARYTTGYDRLRQHILDSAYTPSWAARITGIPEATIVSFARRISAHPTAMTANWSLQRAEFGEQPFWMLIALGAMLGSIGKPGLGVSFGHGSQGGMGAPRTRLPTIGLPSLPNPMKSDIPVARITDMLLGPAERYNYDGEEREYPHIRMIMWAGGNPFHHHQDLGRLSRAWARAQTIVVSEPWWTATARRADIVLPATTTFERNDIASGSRDRYTLAMKQALHPFAGARNDFDMYADIAEYCGARTLFTEGRDEGTWLRFMYGRFKQSASAHGVLVPDFEEFWERGFVEIEPPKEPHVPLASFLWDPIENPLSTPSGRIELYSETIGSFGYSDCIGHPTWFAPKEYLGADAAKTFPLHLLTAQPETRLHSQLDQARVSLDSKILGREPIVLNTSDAAHRGISEGDIVRVFNDRGSCLAGVRLTDDLLPQVAVMATGAWYDPLDPLDPDSMCIHGNSNVLTQDVGTSSLGQGPSAQSCLVDVERWHGALPAITVHMPPARSID